MTGLDGAAGQGDGQGYGPPRGPGDAQAGLGGGSGPGDAFGGNGGLGQNAGYGGGNGLGQNAAFGGNGGAVAGQAVAGGAAPQPLPLAPELAVLGARPLSPTDPAMVGRYRIHGLLGVGGMGRVYLGSAQGFGPGRSGGSSSSPSHGWVAVKVIRPDLADNPEFRRRFARELEAVGRVRTRHAAALVHGEPHAAQPWMATEFVPGVALIDAVRPGSPLPDPAVWRLAADLGSALVAVHQAELVHRDVKPSNVILGDEGAEIIDFGVAHASDLSQLTATGINVGTPSYMAPEQAKSGEVTPASDIFSLGVLLYFAATGKLPFGEGGTAEVLFRVVYEEPDYGSLDQISPALREVVLRCLAKDPLSRPNAAGLVALTQSAATAGAWAPGRTAQWPPALAERISERTRAAGRTVPDQISQGIDHQAPVIPVPPALPPDELQTVSVDGRHGPGGPGRRSGRGGARRGRMIAGAAAVSVVALGIVAMLVWGPGAGGSGKVDSLTGTGSLPGTGVSLGGGGAAASANPAGLVSPTASPSASGSASPSGTAPATSASAGSGAHGSSASAAATGRSGGGATTSAPAAASKSAGAPATSASPVNTGCAGWNAVERGSEYGYGAGSGSWNLYIGPYSACATTGFTVAHGDQLRFWCYVTNAYGNQWTYVQDTVTGKYGWISDSNFVGGVGSTNRC